MLPGCDCQGMCLINILTMSVCWQVPGVLRRRLRAVRTALGRPGRHGEVHQRVGGRAPRLARLRAQVPAGLPQPPHGAPRARPDHQGGVEW